MAGISTVVTTVTGFMSDVVQVITAEGNEFMLIGIAVGLFGAAIGLVKRLIG